jgi:hypothetical protein
MLKDVLLDYNCAYMHKLTHLYAWKFFMLADRLCPIFERQGDGIAKAI